jgi:hypothetical protein
MVRGRVLSVTVALVCVCTPFASAQTNDPVFGQWQWAPGELGSRPGGLAGAFVAVADEGKAAIANPAGLTLIPLREVSLSSGEAWVAAAGGPRYLRLAGYWTTLDDRRVETASDGAPGGFLEATQREGGLALSAQPFLRLRLGATVGFSRLRIEGQQLLGAGGEPAGTTFRGEETRARFTGGLLFDLIGTERMALPSLRLGVSYQPGVDWSLERTPGAASPSEERPSSMDFRRPTVIAFGLSGRPSERWSIAAQIDVIRYREVLETLRRNIGVEAAAGFEIGNAVEPRLGVEFAAPLSCGCGLVRLRAGVHYASPGALRYEGLDEARRTAFAGRSWRTVATLGGSFLAEYFGQAWRLDLDSRDLFEGPELSFGIVWRF